MGCMTCSPCINFGRPQSAPAPASCPCIAISCLHHCCLHREPRHLCHPNSACVERPLGTVSPAHLLWPPPGPTVSLPCRPAPRYLQVRVVASLPCYSESNVDAQRGRGVFDRSIAGLRLLNAAGYGVEGSGLQLDLVYNPGGAGVGRLGWGPAGEGSGPWRGMP